MKRTLFALALLAVSASLVAAQPSGKVDFSRYVSIGDSLTAGYLSGGLVQTTQVRDYPALIASRGGLGSGFQQPLISEPGIPALLYLKSLVPLVIERKPGMGVPINLNLPRPYNNLGIPGAISLDILQTVTDPDNPFFDIILRGQGTVVQQTSVLNPTFMTVWVGNNDILGAVISGRAIDGVTMTPIPVFNQVMTQLFAVLSPWKSRMIVANIPDVSTIPYATAISIYVTNPVTGQPVLINGQKVPLIGPQGPMVEGSYVLISASSYLAQGYGIPVQLGGNGQPLPDETVLTPDEVVVIRAHVNAFNATIASLAATYKVPLVDVNAYLKEIAAKGYIVGGVTLTTAFVTGGVFSLDGVHPSDIGYAVVANKWIEKINEHFGETIPYVNLAPYLGMRPTQTGWGEWTWVDDMVHNLKQVFLKPEARQYLDRTR
ncbi:MAG: SGNH/GDSL hydrolase family protein [Acidobacteriota bacterium]